jgi:hypothetical protein
VVDRALLRVVCVLFGLPYILMTSFVLRALEHVSKTNEIPGEIADISAYFSPSSVMID